MRFLKRKADPKAKEALDEAHENLRRAKARTPEVREVARSLRVMRERNHFAETFQIIMEGHR